MNQYYCKNFCGGSSDFICQNCLLKEISSRKLLNELINRKLVMVQKDRDTGKISGYFIWEQNIEEVEEKPCIE